MRLRSKLILLLALLTGASVLAYNSWRYSCGACTLHALVTPSIPGYLLLAVNLLLGAVLLLLKRRQTCLHAALVCCCGAELEPAWRHCPGCGRERRP